MNVTRIALWLAGAALACSAATQAPAQDAGPSDQAPNPASGDDAQQGAANDPPSRVARLGYLQGSLSFAPSGANDWVEAERNRPLVTGDKLWADAGARAEIDLGSASVRLDQRSALDFLNLNDQIAQLELTQGDVEVDVRRIRRDESYEVDTPTLAFVADRVGDYRIDVDAQNNATTVVALRGGGTVYGEGGAQVQIHEGQALTFDNAQLSNPRAASVPHDEFETFAATRVQRSGGASPTRDHVSEDVVGYADLDDNGTWSDAPDYGAVWYPTHVADDWAPYRDGHWAWVDPWGWSWVDDEPWGFAPFHYGRWAYIDSRWGWVPGPVDVRPVYAPALVAFVGGGGFGLDVSVGAPIGWFPLGPRDVYFPGYRCGHDYFTNINISNTRVIDRTVVNNYYGGFAQGRVNYAQVNYAYRSNPRAFTAVSRQTFVAGQPVGRATVAVNQAALARATIMPRAAVAPTRQSLLAGRAAARPAPAAALNRSVVAAHTPPPRAPSFAARETLLQRTPGEPLTRAQMHTLAARAPQAAPNVRPVAGAARFDAVQNAERNRAAPPTMAGRGMNPGNPRTAATPNGVLPSARFAHGPAATPNGRGAIAAQHERRGPPQTAPNGRALGPAQALRSGPNGRDVERNRPAPNGALRSSEFAHSRGVGPNTAPTRSGSGPPARTERGSGPAARDYANRNGGHETPQGPRYPNTAAHVANAPNRERMPSTAFAPRNGAAPNASRFERPTPRNENHNGPPTQNRIAAQPSTPHFQPRTESRPAMTHSAPQTVQRNEPNRAFDRPVPRSDMHAPPRQQVQSAPRQEFRAPPPRQVQAAPRQEFRAPPPRQQVQSAPRQEFHAPPPQQARASTNYASAQRPAPPQHAAPPPPQNNRGKKDDPGHQ